ncbi:hypothetical protein N7541_008674 [Penicillium brevicompactum]|uniref:Uncharacterized protein n=1 Tax=Penicillium brevicompactum TaxID=5074 RepID=A0A9W9QZG3_PENBR|nr:uncharacterized protein N7506_003788 [Penicillium brevicompactum]KAJ5343964.1 hypothetical protein N7506_003788 [Penicillium brevicompactum]KAJ5346019.1 hypothetical protein N7452_004023 [Penicillium brevicompactum]KAJ5350947.1 hypothetical protein N7541_008674 [Penicillium brevicompactum]
MGSYSPRCFVDDGPSGLVQYVDSSFRGTGQNGLLQSSYSSAKGKLLYKVQIEHDKETTQGFQRDYRQLAF